MKKLLLIAAVLYAASFAFSFETVLWGSDFESFAEGEIIGQTDAYGNEVKVMNNGDRCNGTAPDAGDYVVTTFDGSKVLKAKRTGGSGGDKGINIKLNWGDTTYNPLIGCIKMTGRVYSIGNGYLELRLGNVNSATMFRWNPYSSDFQNSYIQHFDKTKPAYGVNKEDPNFQYNDNYGIRLWGTKVQSLNTWYNFEIVVGAAKGLVTYRYWTDDNSDTYEETRTANALRYGGYVPTFVSFTAECNGYDAARDGGYWDDVQVSYVEEDGNWVTTFEDDMQSYGAGESLFDNGYIAVGEVATTPNVEATVVDSFREMSLPYGQCAYITLHNENGGYPRTGAGVSLPAEFIGKPNAKIRITSRVYRPDNGIWGAAVYDSSAVVKASFGYYGNYCSVLDVNGQAYQAATLSYVCPCWVNTVMVIANDEEGTPYVEYTGSYKATLDHQNEAFNFSKVYDIKLDDDVMYTGIQVQAWGSDYDQPNPGRYALLNYLKIEYQAPEPGFIALALLLGLAFVRKMR